MPAKTEIAYNTLTADKPQMRQVLAFQLSLMSIRQLRRVAEMVGATTARSKEDTISRILKTDLSKIKIYFNIFKD